MNDRGLLSVLAVMTLGCAEKPTFHRDVAPIVFRKCAPCHRPDGAGPFSLLNYRDVRKRASQIQKVTADRYMPPWLPEPGLVAFADERSLDSSEVEVIRRWVEAGAPEGDASHGPKPPRWSAGWELGEPDLVLKMDPYELPPEGPDVFRNFVVPIEIDRVRYVRGFDFRPGGRAVHHAALLIDETSSSRRLDAKDAEPGIDGMVLGSEAAMPGGHFLGWTPGKRPYESPEGLSFTLRPGSDLVIQLHMPTTGKRETVEASVGLYFTEKPPERTPFVIRLGSRRIDIPPGEARHTIRDAYALPVDVHALSIYPHAHYLGKEVSVTARLPDGSETWLLKIPDWDFNWQDIFRYAEPLRLPRGTTLTMELVYDNSEENSRNPSQPPKRVRYGPQSTDEMGDVYVELLPERQDQHDELVRDFVRKDRNRQIEELLSHLAEAPHDADARNSLGVAYDAVGRADEALAELRRAVELDPSLAIARFNLGTLLLSRGDRLSGIAELRRAAALDGENAETRVRLGNALRDQGDLSGAELELARALELDPAHGWGRYSLALVLQLQGRVEDALSEYARAVPLRPDDPELRVSYAAALAGLGRADDATRELEEAIRLAPDWSEPRTRLAEIRQERR
jgi:tetratricopeptide (TPR) repeat protein